MQEVRDAPSKVPIFHSVQEEAEFWDTHSTTEFEDEWEPVEVEISPDLVSWRIFLVEIEYAAFDQIRALAQQQGMTPSELAREWLLEALARSNADVNGSATAAASPAN